MKRRFKTISVTVILLLVISLSLNIVFAVAQGAEPGSDQDPIVSKSYVDAVVAQLSAKVQLLLEQNDALKSQNAQLTTRVTAQEKAVKALQEELKTSKSGTSAGTGASGSTGSAGTKTAPPATIGMATVNVDVLNIRAQPNTISAIVGKVMKNETLTLVAKSGGWYKVTTAKGKTGFVMVKLVVVKK